MIAAAAAALVGARFRLHGRDAEHGLDCVGVVALALAAAGRRVAVPTGYRLRGVDAGSCEAMLAAARLRRVAAATTGDVLLCRAGPRQPHLAVRVGDGLVHADAGMRRVVLLPGAPPWPVLSIWRCQ